MNYGEVLFGDGAVVRVPLGWGLDVEGSFALDLELRWFLSIGLHGGRSSRPWDVRGEWVAGFRFQSSQAPVRNRRCRPNLVVFLTFLCFLSFFSGFHFSIVLCFRVWWCFGAPLLFPSPSRLK